MKMNCPKCENRPLTSTAKGGARCTYCGGMFVPRGQTPELAEDAASQRDGSHDSAGGQCPLDRSIMTRTRVELEGREAVHLERCPSCKGVWFDAGEWKALADRHLLDSLDEFWTAEWRARQRRDRDRANYEQRMQETFGPELYAQLQKTAEVLKGHQRRSQALAFLREESAD
jgi:Zn-finger nucleic acid-binding protein